MYLVVLVLLLFRQCYQYVAFASTVEISNVIRKFAISEFKTSRDTGRLIVSILFCTPIVLSLSCVSLIHTLFLSFVRLRCAYVIQF